MGLETAQTDVTNAGGNPAVSDTSARASADPAQDIQLTQSQTAESQPVQSGQGTAYSLPSAIGFFNVIVGLMLVAAFLLFFGGLSTYFSRLGLVGREEGLYYMYWGVTVLFVLIILLWIVQSFLAHPALLYTVFAFIVIAIAAWIAYTVATSGGEEEEH